MEIIQKASVEIIPEILSFTIDLAAGEVISTHDVVCVESVTETDVTAAIILSHTNNDSAILLDLQAGETDKQYLVTGTIVTSFGNTYNQTFILLIVDPAADLYTSAIDNNFVIAVDYGWDIQESVGEHITEISVAAASEDGEDVLADLVSDTGFDTSNVYVRVRDGIPENLYIIGVLATTSLGHKYYEIIHLRIVDA